MSRIAWIMACVLLAGAAAADDETAAEIWLRSGADLAATASADGRQIVIGLIDRLWSVDPDDGFATQLSDDVEIARAPSLSPDGRSIAYETVRDGHRQIMIRNADGSAPRQITYGDFDHRSPTWSRPSPARPFAGRRVTMSSNRGGHFGIWEVDVNTLDLTQLTFAASDESEPAWDEAGEWLAWVAETNHGTALYTMQPGSRPQRVFEDTARIRAPTWRPGGGVLIYTRQHNGENQLRMLLLSKPAVTKAITQREDVFAHPAVWFDRTQFWYTADGQIQRRRFGERDATPVPFNARLEARVTERPAPPLELDARGNHPARGNSGRSAMADGGMIIGALGDLWVIGPDGTARRQLTSDAFVDAQPAIEPGGHRIAFVSDRSGSLQVWLLDPADGTLQQMTHEDGIALAPRWRDAHTLEYDTLTHAAAANVRVRSIPIGPATSAAGEPAADRNSPETLRRDPDTANTAPDASRESPADSGASANEPGRRDPDRKGGAWADTGAVGLTWQPYASRGKTIIQAGRIFDGMHPDYLERQEIVIDGDRIVAIRPWNDVPPDDSTRVVDAREQTVMPGLIDMATTQPRLGDERLGRKYLAWGVTTIRESVTNPAAARERAESWASGRRAGPRLLVTQTPCASRPGVSALPVLEPTVAEREFITAIDDAIADDAVAIGVCAALNSSARVDVIAAVHTRGFPARTGHAFPDILLGADETRAPRPVRAGYADFSAITGALGTVVTSNLAQYGIALAAKEGELANRWQYRELFTAAEQAAYATQLNPPPDVFETRIAETRAVARSVASAVGRGALGVTGSDSPLVPPGLGLHAELRLLVRAGLRPPQALRMATGDAGRALGADGRLGVIRPGAIADLVIVDGDPLTDIGDAARVRATITRGRPYTRRELVTPGSRPATVGILYN